MTIGQVAAQAGLQASAIRYYERIRLLPPPERRSGRRIYGSEVVRQLSVIRFATEIGFTLDEIALLLHDCPEQAAPPLSWRTLAKAKVAQVDEIIARATAVRRILASVITCNCQKLEDCANALAQAQRDCGEAAANSRRTNLRSDESESCPPAAGMLQQMWRPRETVEALPERRRVASPGSSTIRGLTSPIGGPIGKRVVDRLRRAPPADNHQNELNSRRPGARTSRSPS
jgi:MerR family redox-sensitive transcriptional activator SoxR